MSVTTGPFTITPTGAGSTVQIPQPLAVGQASQLVLDNLTSYLLTVTIGPNSHFQAPLVEAAYDLAGTNNQPVIVSAIPQAGDLTTAGTLAPTWNFAGEEIKGQWPIALSGPAEIAAATAAALLNSGVPNVLTETLVASNVFVQHGQLSSSPLIDVHSYASLKLLSVGAPTANYQGLYVTWCDSFGDVLDSEEISIPPDPNASQQNLPLITLPVRAAKLYLSNPWGTDALITIIGSNRAVAGMRCTAGAWGSDVPNDLQTGNTVMTAGTIYPLGWSAFTGPVWLDMLRASGAAGGELVAQYGNWSATGHGSSPAYIRLANTTELNSSNALAKQIILPPVPVVLAFHCLAAGTSNIIVNLAPGGLPI